MPSVFSRIVQGEIPATKVYEDEQTLAFLDINPASRGHTLVIPKREHADLLDLPDEELIAVARTTQRVARAIMDALQPDGLNVVQNNRAAAGQIVFHYHVHLIPRWKGDRALTNWQQNQATATELDEVAAEIRAACGQ